MQANTVTTDEKNKATILVYHATAAAVSVHKKQAARQERHLNGPPISKYRCKAYSLTQLQRKSTAVTPASIAPELTASLVDSTWRTVIGAASRPTSTTEISCELISVPSSPWTGRIPFSSQRLVPILSSNYFWEHGIMRSAFMSSAENT
jgi:hypothetical protein